MNVQRAPANYYAAFGKRAFDVLFSATALAVLWPLILVLWAAVRLDGGKTGLYGHTRVGMNGRPFKCWKLRTMIVDAETELENLLAADTALAMEWSTTRKLKNDPRITRTGQFLRKSRLDELPQFWNVLIGDMSVVGPRPVTHAEIALYGGNAKTVLQVKPGITGQWQVSGYAVETYEARVKIDLVYVARMTFPNDIKIILQTLRTIIRLNGH